MNIKEAYSLLEILGKSTNIPIHITHMNTQQTISYPDLKLNQFLNCVSKESYSLCIEKNVPVILSFSYIIFSGYIQLDSETELVFGPISTEVTSQEQLFTCCDSSSFTENKESLVDLLLFQPKISVDNLINTMILAMKLLKNLVLAPSDFLMSNINREYKNVDQTIVREQLTDREELVCHTPYDFEVYLMSYIESGDFSGFMRTMQSLAPNNHVKLSYNDDRHNRYNFVAAVTLACRAAVRGGVNSNLAYEVSDVFCRQMDNTPSPFYAENLVLEMIKTYCQMVLNTKQDSSTSHLISQCKYYVSVHLYENIKLDDLSKECNLSPRRLSLKYKEETGESIIEYIRQEKIKEACRLIRHTSYSLSDIGNILSYSTQSHFITTFKNCMGCTPKEYSRNLQK